MSLSKLEAMCLVGGEAAVDDEETIDASWGWVFQLRNPHSVLGLSPVFVNKSDGSVFWPGTAKPAHVYAAEYEARMTPWNRRIVTAIRRRFFSPPYCAEPRMPRNYHEAEWVRKYFDGANGRYYFKADVQFENGSFEPDIMFDSRARIAVSSPEDDLVFLPRFYCKKIAALLMIEDAGGRRLASEDERRKFRIG